MRIWTFQVSGSAKCVTQRGVGLLGSDATGVMLHVMLFPTAPPMGPLGRPPPQSRSSGLPTRSSGPRHIPPRNNGHGSVPGVCPSPGGNESGKKAEAGELLQALSLLQKNYDSGRLCKVPGLGGS